MKLKEFDIMLDIKKHNKIECIEIVQGDFESNVLNISIVEDLKPYNLAELNVEIAFAKPDGTTVLQDEENGVIIEDPAEGKIRCILNTNTIAASGKVFAEVRILQDLRLLTTARFDFFVRRAIVNDETIESTNEFPILNKLINDVGEITESVPVIEGKLDEITNTESGLNQSIVEGNTLKTDLDNSIQEGTTVKTNLDTSIAEGNAVKGELDDIIAGTDFEQVITDLNNKADKIEVENLAGVGRTTETVKQNADDLVTLQDELETHKAEDVTQAHGLEYEEGEWIPVLSALTIPGTHTYEIQDGKYHRVGNSVTLFFRMRVGVVDIDDNMQGSVTISGLPFTPRGIGQNNSLNIGRCSNFVFTEGYTNIAGNAPGLPRISLLEVAPAGTRGATARNFQDGFEILGTFIYYI